MAANQVGSGTEACILPVRGPPAVRPTIFRLFQFLLVAFQGLDRLKTVCSLSCDELLHNSRSVKNLQPLKNHQPPIPGRRPVLTPREKQP
jgi:hypothetical protein